MSDSSSRSSSDSDAGSNSALKVTAYAGPNATRSELNDLKQDLQIEFQHL